MSAQPIEPVHGADDIIGQTLDNEVAVSFFERRWFGAIAAAELAERDLETLRQVMELSQVAVRHAQSKLTELVSLRDALGTELESGRRPIAISARNQLF